jgi:hypothetical protein
MFKKILIASAIVAVTGLLVFGAVTRTLAKSGEESASAGLGGNGRNTSEVSTLSEGQGNGRAGNAGGNAQAGSYGTAGLQASAETHLLPAASGELSEEEAAALLYMREEEKLARDVYTALYEQWGASVFQTIASSEQAHMDSILTLLERYSLTDPASTQAGVFTNPDLQALYTQLVATGSQSLADALKVGGAIEEIDILDLDERLAVTDNADIQQVFNSLLKGSYNHLRAFSTNLLNQVGETYVPQYMTAEQYQEILASSGGNGGANGYHGGRP